MIKELLNKGNYSLKNLSRVNILVGKNGCGKSTLLKKVEEALLRDSDIGKVRYITPERGGRLQYQPNVEQNILNDTNWLSQSRRANQFIQFREQSMVHYRKLELLCLREIEKDSELRRDSQYTFDTIVSSINSLLDNVEIRREDSDFGVYGKIDREKRKPEDISSGESELISLAIECLSFNKVTQNGKVNFLFLDEPDVHLHPDLQTRLVQFLRELVDTGNFQIIVATHSTAFLGAFGDYEHVRIAFMTFGKVVFDFLPILDVCRKILPVFGAHPLSNLFNQAPVVLVEGEDDERIWQQAVRTSRGRLNLFPCSVDGVSDMNAYEQEVKNIIEAVYDEAQAYSIRDRDEGPEDISDLMPIIRFKLSCRAAENLLLSDDVLESLGTNWVEVRSGIQNWLRLNEDHTHFRFMNAFCKDDFPRKRFDLKEIRNDLMGIIGSSKPWEVAVGQAIAKLNLESLESPDSLASYLGTKIVHEFFGNGKLS